MSDEQEQKKRSAGEKVRLRHSIDRMRAVLNGVEAGMQFDAPLGNDVVNAVMTSATEIALQISKHDAFLLAEEDAQKKEPSDVARTLAEGLEKRPFKKR